MFPLDPIDVAFAGFPHNLMQVIQQICVKHIRGVMWGANGTAQSGRPIRVLLTLLGLPFEWAFAHVNHLLIYPSLTHLHTPPLTTTSHGKLHPKIVPSSIVWALPWFPTLPVNALWEREHCGRTERTEDTPRSSSVREGRAHQSAHTGRAQAGVYHRSCSSQTKQLPGPPKLL